MAFNDFQLPIKCPGSDCPVRQTIESIISQYIDSNDSAFWQPAMVVAAALFEGPNVERIAAVTGYSPEYVELIATRMRASGLWTNDSVDYSEWLNPETGAFTFMMDVMVAQGMLIRTNRVKNGRYLYEAVPCDGIQGQEN